MRFGLAVMGAVLAAALQPVWANEPHPADAEADDAAFYDRAAQCAAVMKSQVMALSARYEAGETATRAEIVRLTELTFTMVGKAYLRGLRGQAADRLLDAAEVAQKDWSDARRRSTSASCQREAQQMFDDANFLERMLVRNRSDARVRKLLDRSD